VLNRYLSALHEGDRALGDLLRGLDRRGLLESTLVIVMGDHGEAFGQHAHTNHHLLYEEDLHIPLLLINERLFHGERDSTVGASSTWRPPSWICWGTAPGTVARAEPVRPRPRRPSLSLCAFLQRVFRLCRGIRKLIYNASSNTAELYDLNADPGRR